MFLRPFFIPVFKFHICSGDQISNYSEMSIKKQLDCPSWFGFVQQKYFNQYVWTVRNLNQWPNWLWQSKQWKVQHFSQSMQSKTDLFSAGRLHLTGHKVYVGMLPLKEEKKPAMRNMSVLIRNSGNLYLV